MQIHDYKVGDKAIVTVDYALGSTLMAGDFVIINSIIKFDGRDYCGYNVTDIKTGDSHWLLNYEVMEPAEVPLENV